MDDRQRMIRSIAAFALPVAITKAASLLFGGAGPAGAAALPAPPPEVAPPTRPVAERSWTPAQQAAAAHVAFLRTQPIGPGPLLYDEAGPDTAPAPAPVANVPPRAPLQVILDAGPDSIAYFGGKRYRVGDALEGSPWVVLEIDGPGRSVTVQHRDTGEKHMYVLGAPVRN